jgi:hypothetical protein
MTGINAHRTALDGLRHLDNQLLAESDEIGRVRDTTVRFRNTMFEALGWVEEQCFQLKALQIRSKREEANLARVEVSERLPFIVCCDPEPAVALELPEGPALVGRIHAIMAPPVPGLLRQYSIHANGVWRRTTFTRDRAGQSTAKTVAAPSFSGEMLLLEVVDLIQLVTTLRFVWPEHAADAGTRTLDDLRDRARNRDFAIGAS